ncbi:hypothetical protein COV61_05235 [Candidatus Micrarchaeota archaeon CG11_big_fil_rev_8_21_14_0_20_47_5]|nr:MAG: hypothetical protein AUJ17_02370 [Candidatus Micrarchaeota archaeon CG1_02_47_40]PIN82699.1 MAG: hypothetical protein COV61_05235 [Candidatus Micrarchaeota archaeon CG11_big_fil_rev_8_21_14_0_20_47_5]
MNKYFKMFGFGLLIWLIPFIAGFLFFDASTQKLTIDETFFKSIMIVLSCFVGVFLLLKYFAKVKEKYLQEAVAISIIWLAINWLLDFVILLPMSKMDAATYFMQIGMRYLMVPIIAVGMAKMKEGK